MAQEIRASSMESSNRGRCPAMIILMTTLVFLFVISVLSFVGYALVRPFTHVHYRHRSGLWSHLP